LFKFSERSGGERSTGSTGTHEFHQIGIGRAGRSLPHLELAEGAEEGTAAEERGRAGRVDESTLIGS